MPDGTNLSPTLADVLVMLEADTDLAPTRRRDLCSAVRRLAGLLGRDPRKCAQKRSLHGVNEHSSTFSTRPGDARRLFTTPSVTEWLLRIPRIARKFFNLPTNICFCKCGHPADR